MIPSWIIYQIIGIFFVFIAQVSNRYFGFTFYGVSSYCLITVFLLSWLLPLSYQLAPSFFQPFFLGIILLCIFGLFGSYIIFGDKITLLNILGIIISIIGCLLINI